MTNLSEIQIAVASETAAFAAERYIAPIRLIAKNFSPEASTEFNAVAVPIVDLGNANAFDKTSNNWCNGTELSAETVQLNKHAKVGITIDDVTAGTFGEDGNKYALRAGADGVARALAKNVADTFFTELSGATATPVSIALSAIRAGIAGLHAGCSQAGVDPSNSIVVLNPTAYGALLDTLTYAQYGDQEAVKYGVIENLYGFRGVVEATSTLPLNAEGFVVPYEAVAMVARYNKPAIASDAMVAWPAVEEKTGLPIGFRLFENLCEGRLVFGGDVLFGVKLIQPSKVIPLQIA